MSLKYEPASEPLHSGGDKREWDPVGHACLVGGEPAGEVNLKP